MKKTTKGIITAAVLTAGAAAAVAGISIFRDENMVSLYGPAPADYSDDIQPEYGVVSVWGDFNDDERVNLTDLQLMLEKLRDHVYDGRYDLNRDNALTEEDLSLLKEILKEAGCTEEDIEQMISDFSDES